MIETKKYLMLAASLALTLFVQSGFVMAQSASQVQKPRFPPRSVPQLAEYQKSVALFDIRVDQLIKDAVAAGVLQKAIDQMKLEGLFGDIKLAELEGLFGDIKLAEIDRVFGAFCLSESIEKAMLQRDNLDKHGFPIEFFVRVKFRDSDSLERMQTRWTNRLSKVTLFDGKEYLTGITFDPHGLHLPFLLAQRVDKTTFEFGTQTYLLQPKRDFFTARLKTAFAAAPKDSIRLVVDLETRRKFLQQVATMAKEKLATDSSAYFDLIDNAKSLVITSSLSSENLLSMIAEANNDFDAEELAEGIDGLIGIAKVELGKTFSQTAPLVTPEMEEPLRKLKGLVETLAATQSGSTVKVIVKKPEGFAEAMNNLQKGIAAQGGTE